MAIAQGVAQQLRYKKQSAKGTLAGATLGQVLRRTSGIFKLQKEVYDTADEITSTQQLVSSRHGVRMVDGAISGILSPGTYADLIGSLLRRAFAAVTASTGVSVTIAGSGPTYTVTRAAGSYLTDGYKIGMVVRLSVGTLNAANINKNLLITGVTATILTVMPLNGVALVAEGPIASTTVTATGKVTYAPITGHTNDYYTFETWNPDVPASEVNQDVQIASASFSLPGSGNATIDIAAIGLDQTRAATVYFSSPTAETSTESLVAASGVLLVNGTAVATITDLSFEINGNVNAADGVVGSNVRPDVFRGKILVNGSFTAYYESTTIPALFLNETDVSIVSALANGTSATADFMTISIPKLNLNTDDQDDGETGLKRTYSFTAEYYSAGGAATAHQQSTIQIQDSQAA
jgi:hypothetical protein